MGSSSENTSSSNLSSQETKSLDYLLNLLGDLHGVASGVSADGDLSSSLDPEVAKDLASLQQLLMQSATSQANRHSSATEPASINSLISQQQHPHQLQRQQPQQSSRAEISNVSSHYHLDPNYEQPELWHLRQLVNYLEEKLANLEQHIYEPNENLNSLIPLILELLQLKINDSQESILQAVVPVVEKILQQRNAANPQGMSEAIAPILPNAITSQINNSPQTIAKAIAPEIASAMQEQIRLKPEAIPQALGSQMGKAIQTQIEVEPQAMVDALYPVIGNTITKYLSTIINQLNQQLEANLTPAGIRRKIRAKLQGISVDELVFTEVMGFSIQAIFLMQQDSDLVISEVYPAFKTQIDPYLRDKLLINIRDFVANQNSNDLDLDELEYKNYNILFAVTDYCYLALVCQGEPTQSLLRKAKQNLNKIRLNYGREIVEFNGDPATVPLAVKKLLEELTKIPNSAKVKPKPPTTLLIFLFALLSIILLPWGYWQYRHKITQRLEAKIVNALDAEPELSIYRLVPQINQGKLTLTGRVPYDTLKTKAAQIASLVAPELELNNQIVAVAVPPDPIQTAAEIQRLTSFLNQSEGVAISSHYQARTVTIEGTVLKDTDLAKIPSLFQKIPGVNSVISSVQLRLPTIDTRIYFDVGSVKLKPEDIATKINRIKNLLRQNPDLHLRIIAHSYSVENSRENQSLAIGRAKAVQKALIVQGINASRLKVATSIKLPPDVNNEQPLWMSRCVRFEIFIP